MPSLTATRGTCDLPTDWRTRRRECGFGCLAGLALFLWSFQYLATFGTSAASTSALIVTLGLGGWLSLVARQALQRSNRLTYVDSAAWLVIAVWTVAFVWLLAAGRSFVGLMPTDALVGKATTFCIMLSIATGLFVVPVAGCLWLAQSTHRLNPRASSTPWSPLFVLGVSAGLLSGPTLLAPWKGLAPLMVTVTAVCCTGFWRSMMRAAESSVPIPHGSAEREADSPWVMGVSLLLGLEIPVSSRMALQLMPGSPFEHYAAWAGLLVGIAGGLGWAAAVRRRNSVDVTTDGPLTAAMVATMWPVILLGVWGLLVDAQLSVNSTISAVPLVMTIRILVAGIAIAPLGYALGRLWGSRALRTHETLAAPVVCFAAGIALSRTIALPAAPVAVACAATSLMVAVGRYWVLGLPAPGSISRRVACAATVLCIALLPMVAGNHRPDLAARLLFSTSTFSALQSGISRDLLPYLDDGRLVAMEADGSSTWTVWKHRGSQLALRENGLPRGVLSTDPLTSPQFAGEVMPAVVPMVLHERPESVLMLGMGSTAALNSVLACPVTSVTCVEGDDTLIRLVSDVLAPAAGVNPLADDRVRLLNVEPTLAILTWDDPCDVLIVNESQPSVMGATSSFTREFYQAARKALRDDGLLCQRLQYADFGNEPIEDLLATVQSVFPQVALFDAAPGEMLIVATGQPGPLVSEATIDRCESTHIRNLMAQVGWDWSVLMNLGAISPDAVAELTKTRGQHNSVANGHFAFRLPQEVLRWSSPQLPKWQQRQRLLNAHASRMLAWIGESERTKQVQQRLADVIEQQRLITAHADHYWAYRKTLKERLTERPRGVIQQVKHEGLKRSLHPEDRRRKEYLEVLGAAATASDPAQRDIRRLSEFAVPYDPLVSYFLHQEAARLYEKSSASDPAARFHHLRYSVYFGPPSDQSVRNVVAALQLLNDHPELYPDAQRRWDEMNSLLEVLKQRSSLRLRADQTASTFELVDAERSINVSKRTMATMDSLHAEAGIPAEAWTHRRTVLERMLVRPMWTYHSQQAARLARQHAQTEAISEMR